MDSWTGQRLRRFFHVGFESHESVFAGFVEQVVHHFQSVDVGLLAELGAAEDAADASGDFLDDVQRVADQNCADGGAADDDQFRGLHQDAEVTVLHEVAGDDASEDDHDADDCKHS